MIEKIRQRIAALDAIGRRVQQFLQVPEPRFSLRTLLRLKHLLIAGEIQNVPDHRVEGFGVDAQPQLGDQTMERRHCRLRARWELPCLQHVLKRVPEGPPGR